MDSLKAISLVALGDPVMDVLIHVSHEEMAALKLEPGGCIPIDGSGMLALLEQAGHGKELLRIPGGSAANVMKGVANISSGTACCKFIGMVGVDTTGVEYRSKLTEQRVEPLLLESTTGEPSAVSLCLVTPDGQRTMRTCLGASLGLQSAAQVAAFQWGDGCRLLHCEGYCLYRPQLAREMMTLAKAAGALVSIDLASFELVRHCHAAFTSLLEAGLLDLVFANEEEAIELNRVLQVAVPGSTPSPEAQVLAAQQHLLAHCRTAVVSLGPRGCVARTADGRSASSPAGGVKVVDTIGAGDFFTAGFLVAHLGGGDLSQCCAAGCAAGSEAVQATGAQLGAESVARLQARVAAILMGAAGGGGKAAVVVSDLPGLSPGLDLMVTVQV